MYMCKQCPTASKGAVYEIKTIVELEIQESTMRNCTVPATERQEIRGLARQEPHYQILPILGVVKLTIIVVSFVCSQSYVSNDDKQQWYR